MKEKGGFTTGQLAQFLAVVKMKNYRKAADSLGLAQPSLHQSVSKMERDLGFKLLTRIGRGGSKVQVEPTEKGKQVVKMAKRILKTIDKMKSIGGNNGEHETL